MNKALRILAGALMVLVGILVIGTTPPAAVFAFIAAALTFGSAALPDKKR